MTDAPPDAASVEMSHLFAQFESLGDNCEFGFVQKQAGALNISLLRWAGISYQGLLKGLAQDFEGLFAFDRLAPVWTDMVADREYGVSFHTQFKIATVDGRHAFAEAPEALVVTYAKEAARIALLRRKFIEGLDTGERIYVYKHKAAITPAELDALKAGLDRRRPQRLLCVAPEGPWHAAGRVMLVRDGLKLGALARFAPPERTQDGDFDNWVSICRAAAGTPWRTAAKA